MAYIIGITKDLEAYEEANYRNSMGLFKWYKFILNNMKTRNLTVESFILDKKKELWKFSGKYGGLKLFIAMNVVQLMCKKKEDL